MSELLFSILTPAVPSRLIHLGKLAGIIGHQIGDAPIEHLILLDNKRRTVGEKRDALLRAARGRYIAFVDDDDMISHDYVHLILQKILKDPDVITFRQEATVNNLLGEIHFQLGNENEPFKGVPAIPMPLTLPVTKRNAWHVCAWRRILAIQSHFPAINYGEDWAFASPLCALARREEHIPKVLHFYRHNSATTEAPFLDSLCCPPPQDGFRLATGK